MYTASNACRISNLPQSARVSEFGFITAAQWGKKSILPGNFCLLFSPRCLIWPNSCLFFSVNQMQISEKAEDLLKSGRSVPPCSIPPYLLPSLCTAQS